MPDMSASVSLAMTHLVPLAKEVDENKVTPGVLGFIVFAAMAVAVWGLMRSMSKHMGKVDFKESVVGAERTSGGTPTDAPRDTAAQTTTGKPSSAT
ncbi:hypothetical protein [Streptomyces sp. B4I13]|uniref:hypothetical protein n=1 Tax=Streptomyces sp. B4I13 TaxID=3042271 RepID=UPI0027D7AA98|nr:hypothetical protein [Streptomyces sp. B4I13]